MAKLPDFGKMYGPLPLGAWIIVVGGGVGIALYTRSQRNNEPEIVEDVSGVDGVGTGANSQWIQTEAPEGGTGGEPAVTTNEEWAVKAIRYLVSYGMDPVKADAAVRKYITAMPLNAMESGMLAIVIGRIGPPPTALPVPETPTPTPTPTPTVPQFPSWRHTTVTPAPFWLKPPSNVTAKPFSTRKANYNLYCVQAMKVGNTTYVRTGPPYSFHGWWVWVQTAPGKAPVSK